MENSVPLIDKMIPKPSPDEYPAYASIYIDLLPDDGLILHHLAQNLIETQNFISAIPSERLLYRYAEAKWTIKEIVGHLIDDERIYAYRALRFARNDSTMLPGFEQDHYAVYSEANGREISDLLDEFAAVRASTIALFSSFSDTALLRKGVADQHCSSVRALAYHIAGHELRHVNIVRERYL